MRDTLTDRTDIRYGVPTGFTHIPGKRLTVTCKSLGIEHSAALTGWKTRGRYSTPIINGVIVRKEDADRLLEAIEKRNSRRLTADQREAARERRHKRDAKRLADVIAREFPGMPESERNACAFAATEIGSGRAGRSSTVNDQVSAAVTAHVRHWHTDYEQMLSDGMLRQVARLQVRDQVHAILDQWRQKKDR